MKYSTRLACAIFLMMSGFSLMAQDEGAIVKRERIDKSKGIFLDVGPSFTLGKNIGDYSVGYKIEVGFTKRLNRIVSIGPSISYLHFSYDQEKSNEDFKNIFSGGPYNDEGGTYYEGAFFQFTGGDLNITSLALNLKFNFVPVKDNSVISAYAFAKPFVSVVSRTEVKGVASLYQNYGDIDDSFDWEYVGDIPWESNSNSGIEVSDKLKSGTEMSGGIFIGPGLELFPARAFSFYAQASIGYTLPLTFVSTKAYQGQGTESLVEGSDFPMTKKGFPSWGIQIGASYNF